MHLLVTGAGGFLGKALLRLIPNDIQVTTLDRVPLPGNHIYCDITEERALANALSGLSFDVVVHLAGLTSGTCVELFRINAQGTLNLSSTVTCERFISASSCAVYGEPVTLDGSVCEAHPLNPAGEYGRSMLAREQAAPSAVHLRLFNVIGPGQNARMLVPALADKLARIALGLSGEPLLTGPLHTERDYVDVVDAAGAFLAAVHCTNPEKRVNIGSGKGTSGTRVFEALCDAMGVSPRAETRDLPAGVARICADASLAGRNLGWSPKTTFEDSIREVAEDMLKRVRREIGATQ